eukprot:XP_011660965.1 PREDICTED: uncharacterized protein LOC585309 [Strongylocentrotus purpuratus]
MADTEQAPATEEQTPTKQEVKTEEAAPAPAAEGGEEEGKTGNGEGGEKEKGEEKEEEANGEAKQAEAPVEVCLDAPTENPLTDEDYQDMLKLDAAESEEGWERIKKHKDVIVYRKAEKNGSPVIKASMDFTGIPVDKVLEFFTDPEQRRKWNKKSPTFEVLEEKEDFKVVYT